MGAEATRRALRRPKSATPSECRAGAGARGEPGFGSPSRNVAPPRYPGALPRLLVTPKLLVELVLRVGFEPTAYRLRKRGEVVP